MKDFNIVKYEFINDSYGKDDKYIHWSRIYEWKYVINFIKTNKPNSIHNTACGGLNVGDCLHLTFCGDIDKFIDNTLHSDVWGRTNYIGIGNKPIGNNFIYYDILTELNKTFDVVLNISTIEHLPKESRILSVKNLFKQVKIGGHLILTFDFPDVDLNQMYKFLGESPIGFDNRIIGPNNMSVVLLHLIKLNNII